MSKFIKHLGMNWSTLCLFIFLFSQLSAQEEGSFITSSSSFSKINSSQLNINFTVPESELTTGQWVSIKAMEFIANGDTISVITYKGQKDSLLRGQRYQLIWDVIKDVDFLYYPEKAVFKLLPVGENLKYHGTEAYNYKTERTTGNNEARKKSSSSLFEEVGQLFKRETTNATNTPLRFAMGFANSFGDDAFGVSARLELEPDFIFLPINLLVTFTPYLKSGERQSVIDMDGKFKFYNKNGFYSLGGIYLARRSYREENSEGDIIRIRDNDMGINLGLGIAAYNIYWELKTRLGFDQNATGLHLALGFYL